MVQYGPTVTDLVNFADCFGTCYCTSSSCRAATEIETCYVAAMLNRAAT